MYSPSPTSHHHSNSYHNDHEMEVEYEESQMSYNTPRRTTTRSNKKTKPIRHNNSNGNGNGNGNGNSHHKDNNNNNNSIADLTNQMDIDVEEDKYRYERGAINDAQSVAYTAYTMNQESDIVQQLRHVGVTVLSLESLSTAAMINYMDAVTTMRLGNGNDEKCMLYTDRMGRVFNVVISGGATGLENSWSMTQASFSGWIAITALPFLARNAASFSFQGYLNHDNNDNYNSYNNTSTMALDPLFLLFVFGFILTHETSNSMLAISLLVRGTNSVGSYVWRGGSLTDYPRFVLLLLLAISSFASPNYVIRDVLALIGTLLGCAILLCNLGSRAWNKVEIGFIDASNVFTPILTLLASFLAGILLPYVGLRSVDGGTDTQDGHTAVEKIIFNPNGKRARQNVTAAASIVATVFLFSDIQRIQDVLGFDFSTNRAIVNIGMGAWWLVSTLISMSLCHRLDSSKSKKIEPFLKRDETSPVGWVVPSVPNIVIDPNLSRGKMVLKCLSYGSDLICALVAAGFAFLMVWIGIRDLQGKSSSTFWDWS